MTLEHRPKELRETEERALSYLRDATTIPSAPPLTDHRLRLRLWHYPAFKAYRSWSVFELRRRREVASFLVRQVTWDRLHDCQRLRDPLLGLQEGFHSHPKIELRDRPLDASEFARRLAVAHSLSVRSLAEIVASPLMAKFLVTRTETAAHDWSGAATVLPSGGSLRHGRER